MLTASLTRTDLLVNQLHKIFGKQPVRTTTLVRVTLDKELTTSQFVELAGLYQVSGFAPRITRSGAGISVLFSS